MFSPGVSQTKPCVNIQGGKESRKRWPSQSGCVIGQRRVMQHNNKVMTGRYQQGGSVLSTVLTTYSLPLRRNAALYWDSAGRTAQPSLVAMGENTKSRP